MRKSFAGILGYVFIGMGIVGFIIILGLFDWETWNRVKDLQTTYADEYYYLSNELSSTIGMSFVTLIGSLAIGSVLLALDKIIFLLGAINGSVRAVQNEAGNK